MRCSTECSVPCCQKLPKINYSPTFYLIFQLIRSLHPCLQQYFKSSYNIKLHCLKTIFYKVQASYWKNHSQIGMAEALVILLTINCQAIKPPKAPVKARMEGEMKSAIVPHSICHRSARCQTLTYISFRNQWFCRFRPCILNVTTCHELVQLVGQEVTSPVVERRLPVLHRVAHSPSRSSHPVCSLLQINVTKTVG